MKKILPVILAILGVCAGIGSGLVLRGDASSQSSSHTEEAAHNDSGKTIREYVKLNNQFVVPVVTNGTVTSMVLISLSLEVQPGKKELVFVREPKLRDGLLQVMFDYANIGGFAGAFTNSDNLIVLKNLLLETSRSSLGPFVTDVLIIDIARQEV